MNAFPGNQKYREFALEIITKLMADEKCVNQIPANIGVDCMRLHPEKEHMQLNGLRIMLKHMEKEASRNHVQEMGGMKLLAVAIKRFSDNKDIAFIGTSIALKFLLCLEQDEMQECLSQTISPLMGALVHAFDEWGAQSEELTENFADALGRLFLKLEPGSYDAITSILGTDRLVSAMLMHPKNMSIQSQCIFTCLRRRGRRRKQEQAREKESASDQ